MGGNSKTNIAQNGKNTVQKYLGTFVGGMYNKILFDLFFTRSHHIKTKYKLVFSLLIRRLSSG